MINYTIHKLWTKHIRVRFARFYECDDCHKRYRLNRTECPNCGTRTYCPFVDAVTASISADAGGCESDTIKPNGECWDCGYRQELYFQPIAFTILRRNIKSFIEWHFKISKHDHWLGHYSKKTHDNYSASFGEVGDPFIKITHYISIIPGIVFEYSKVRDA